MTIPYDDSGKLYLLDVITFKGKKYKMWMKHEVFDEIVGVYICEGNQTKKYVAHGQMECMNTFIPYEERWETFIDHFQKEIDRALNKPDDSEQEKPEIEKAWEDVSMLRLKVVDGRVVVEKSGRN